MLRVFRKMSCLLTFAVMTLVGADSSQVQAGQLLLNLSGTTSGSTWDGVPIPDGTAFQVRAAFDSTPYHTQPSIGDFLVSSVSGSVGGISFVELDSTSFNVTLADGTNTTFPSYSVAALVNASRAGALGPIFATATPSFDALNPTPTVFSDYVGSLLASLSFSTSSGDLVITYDDITAGSISAVPEPSSLMLALVGGVGSLYLSRRRRHQAIAA